MTRLTTAIIAALVLLSPSVLGQATGSLTGSVTDEQTGEVLAGANVIIQNLLLGGAADAEGMYRIDNVPAGEHELLVRYVGYEDILVSVTVTAGEEMVRDVPMRISQLQLDELVVTGQGQSIEKKRITASVEVLNSRMIEQAPVTSVDQLLQGRVAGATIRMQSAQPGQGAVMNLRGITSAFADQTPVIYIDGIRVDNSNSTSSSFGGEATSAISELLTSDIDRIEVTKGGAASAIYGSDAANGVIQIFTKRGNSGVPQIQFRTEQGPDFPEDQFILDTRFAFPVTDSGSEDADPDNPNFGNTSFVRDNFLKNGYSQDYYLGASGGAANITYNVSSRVQHSTGVQPKNGNTTYALRGNLAAGVADNLEVTFMGAYTRSNFERLFNGTSIADPLTTFEVGDALFFSGEETFEDALNIFLLPDIREEVSRVTLGSTASYRPTPIFGSKLTLGVDVRSNQQRNLNPADFDIVSGDNSGSLARFDRDFTAVTLEWIGTLTYPSQGFLTSDLSFGVQGFRQELSTFQAQAETFALPGADDIDEAAETSAFETRQEIFNGGIFVKEQLGIGDLLFIDAGIRLDGNSTFGSDVGLQAYPSLGAAYTVSDMDFWSGSSLGNLMDQLKLRVAYGSTGKFPGPFTRDRTFQATPFRGESAPRFANPGNSDLRPEKTSTLEAGLDMSILRGFAGIAFTAYTATTRDALFLVPEQPASGLGTQLRNIGAIQNRGVEFSLNARPIATRNLEASFGVNFHAFKNEVTDMGGAADFNVGGSGTRAQQRVSEGMPVGAWRAMTPFDSNGDGMLDDSEFRFLDTRETPYPTKTGSFNASISFLRGFSVYGLMDWALGAQVFDFGSVWADFNGLVRAERPDRFTTDGEPDGTFSTTSGGVFLLQDGDFLKFRELSVQYTIPVSTVRGFGLKGLSLSLSGRNIKTWARTDLLDPELAGLTAGGGLQLGGTQSITLSPPRSWRMSLQVTL